MKKVIQIILVLLLLFAAIIPAQANSGPTYMDANPGLELAVDTGCPIAVTHEDLAFDFSRGLQGNWSPTADVTASYTMTNPSEESVSVTMAFPFVTSLSSPSPGVSLVSVDGKAAEYEIFYGKEVEYGEDLSGLDLSDVLSNVLLEAPEEPEDGTLYTVTVGMPTQLTDTQRLVRMRFATQSEVCYIDGFSGVSRFDDGAIEFSAWLTAIGSNTQLTVFVPGGSLKDYSLNAYASYDSDTPLNNVSFDVAQEGASFRDYMEYCRPSCTANERFFWALLQEVNTNHYDPMYGNVFPVDELLFSVEVGRRLAAAVYTVDFKKGETKNITVQCPLEGTMQRPSGYSMENATYTYTYLSNPAREWASFGTLSLSVIPPENIPLSSSVPELTPDGSGHFTAELSGLPENNITFTLSAPASENKNQGNPAYYLDIIFILIIIVAVAVVVLGVVIAAVAIVNLVRRNRKNRT